MAPVITRLARRRRLGRRGARRQTPDVAERGAGALHGDDAKLPPSPFTCPECDGALWELVEGELQRFRCHVGHSFGVESLLDRKDDGVERALWTALRTLEETALLRRRMGESARAGGLAALGRSYELQAWEAERQAATVRKVLVGESGQVPEDIDDAADERKGQRRVANREGRSSR